MTESASPSTREPTPIVVLGLDAFDVDWLERWVAEGRLPFLAGLIARGSFARLESTRDLFSDAPWPTLNAGVTPAKHAFFNHLQLQRGTLDIARTDAHHCRVLPFWQYLRGMGLRSALMDVPKTFPIEGLDGVQICGWGEHYPLLRSPLSIPPDRVGRCRALYGEHPHPPEIVHPPSRHWELSTRNALFEAVERKRRAIEDLLDEETWDFFFAVFSEVHYADHQFFHHADSNHWAHEPDAPPELMSALADVATRVDAAIGRLFEKIPRGANWFVISVHGIEPNFTANHMMEEVLTRLGYTVPAEHARATNRVGRILEWTAWLRERIPRSVRDRINSRLPERFHDEADSSAFEGTKDWSKTRAFLLPSDHFQALLSLNLDGREPMGIVKPGTEAESLMERLREDLLELRNTHTGRRAVAGIVRTADVYQGPNLPDLPDLIVQWVKDAPIVGLEHPGFGTISAEGYPVRKSQHARDGFLIAGGPGVAEGTRLEGVRTIDFAPTALHLLGQPVPEELDGRVLDELLRAGTQSVSPEAGSLRA